MYSLNNIYKDKVEKPGESREVHAEISVTKEREHRNFIKIVLSIFKSSD